MLKQVRLGKVIEQRREKYAGDEELSVWGVSRDGFISPKQDGANTSIYNVFYKYDFVFNPARMELNSIVLNVDFDKAICSSLYEIFFVSRTDIVLPEYLNMFIKRDEFARKCWFEAIGSARNYFRVANLSEFIIPLPPLEVQKKYAAVYMAMKENQKVCAKSIEDIRRGLDLYTHNLSTYKAVEIGNLIEIVDERNVNLKYDISCVKGVSIEKKFINTKANMDGIDLSTYKIVQRGAIAFNPNTARMGDRLAIALNETGKEVLVSSIYPVFKTNENILLPEYLFMYFNRPEFDRYVRFKSWGSAREVFTFVDMCSVRIPLPPLEVQQVAADMYSAYRARRVLVERQEAVIRDMCPVLIRGSVLEGGV